jgi:hypothetical protein
MPPPAGPVGVMVGHNDSLAGPACSSAPGSPLPRHSHRPRRRRNDASPPGPDSRSTAFPMVVLLHTAGMSTSTPHRSGGRTLIDLDPGQLKWILLARESTRWHVRLPGGAAGVGEHPDGAAPW